MTEWFRDLSPMTKALVQGQWISILIAGTGIFATILSDTHPSTNFPLLMNSFNYLLLSTYLVRLYIKRRSRKDSGDRGLAYKESSTGDEVDLPDRNTTDSLGLPNSSTKPTNIMYWYILAAVLDVEANFLVLLAYNYTTITSVMLLDCFTIPCAMVLSYLFLGCRYNYMHMLGTGICLLGSACIVINDSTNATDDDAPAGSNPVLGDILCLSAAVLYASSNVLQEHLVKFHDREEFLGYLGCFGFGIAVVQCMLVDLPAMRRANFTGKVIGAISGFVICLFLMYTNTTAFLQHGDAVLFNLSLLTSDVYAVVFTYFFSGYLVSWLYFVAFALVIVGLILYHSQPAPLHIGRDFGDVGLFTTIQHSPCGFCCRDAEERRVGYQGVQGEDSSHHPVESAYGSGSTPNKASVAEGSGSRSHPTRREPGSPGLVATMQYSPIISSGEEQP